MERVLLTVIPNLSEEQRNIIREAALSRGFTPYFFDTPREAAPVAEEAEIIFSISPQLTRGAKKLKWMCSPFAGVDPFLVPGAFEVPGALLTNSSGAYGTTISEHIVMTALMLLRRQTEYTEVIRDRGWRRDLPIRSLRDSRITLLGTGDIGRETALRLRGFLPASLTGINRRGDAPEGIFDRVLTVEELDRVLPETDLLIMSLPATPATENIMDARRLSLLGEKAFLINVGRGSALDQSALEDLLRRGRLAGAALDVFRQEPVPREDTLWTCPNLLMTPHVAGNMTLPYTTERILAQFLENLTAYSEGRPLKHVVSPEVGY